MTDTSDTQFIFYAHNHKVTSTSATNDAIITLKVDPSLKESLAPFMFIDSDQMLEVTIRVKK